MVFDPSNWTIYVGDTVSFHFEQEEPCTVTEYYMQGNQCASQAWSSLMGRANANVVLRADQEGSRYFQACPSHLNCACNVTNLFELDVREKNVREGGD
jgi:plastocyanin